MKLLTFAAVLGISTAVRLETEPAPSMQVSVADVQDEIDCFMETYAFYRKLIGKNDTKTTQNDLLTSTKSCYD